MEIKPKKGIDQLLFGMTVGEVHDVLGKADKVFENEDDCNELIHQYNEKKLRLSFFQNEKGKLGYIRCANPDLLYQGKKLIGQPVEKVKSEVFSDLDQDWDVDQTDFFDTHFNESVWLTLNAEYEAVTDVELGVPLNEDEEYDWAK